MKSVEYDVDVAGLHKQPDLIEVEKFVRSDHTSMAITYESKYECQRRRACLRTWLLKNGHYTVYMRVRDNILYVLKDVDKE